MEGRGIEHNLASLPFCTQTDVPDWGSTRAAEQQGDFTKTLSRFHSVKHYVAVLWYNVYCTSVYEVHLQRKSKYTIGLHKIKICCFEFSKHIILYSITLQYWDPFHTSSPWIWKGISSTLRSVRYTHPHPGGRPVDCSRVPTQNQKQNSMIFPWFFHHTYQVIFPGNKIVLNSVLAALSNKRQMV